MGEGSPSAVDSYGYLILEGNQRDELKSSAATSEENQKHLYSQHIVVTSAKRQPEPNCHLIPDKSDRDANTQELDEQFYLKPNCNPHDTSKPDPKYELVSDKSNGGGKSGGN